MTMNERLKDAIKMHYDNKDYTEVVRDAILFLMNEIRAKSDLQDIDGVELINKAFSEKNPYVKINKMQTNTEKNKQKGVMDLSKGLVEYFRNPMSHSKQHYSKEIANAIVTIVDKVLLKEITNGKNINSVEEWYSEITSNLCPTTKRYAEHLVKSIPKNKRYELLVKLYKNKENIKGDKMVIVDELAEKLSEEEFSKYSSIIETDIYGKNSEEDIVEISRFISKEIWQKFSDFGKIKIEEMMLEDIRKCKMYPEYEYDWYINREYGNIAIALKHLISKFSNQKDIIKCLSEKLLNCMDKKEVFDNWMDSFSCILALEEKPDKVLVKFINNRIEEKDEPSWYSDLKRELEKNANMIPYIET